MRTKTVAAGIAAVAAIAISYSVGHDSGDDVTWRSGTAVLGGDDASPQFSATFGDWTYGAQRAVPMWIDAAGSHDGGEWPACLLPPTEQHPERPQDVPIRFATVNVNDGSWGGRVVVTVDCRGG